MKRVPLVFAFMTGILAVAAGATGVARADDSLEQQLEGLNLPSNEAPSGVNQEKLYSVQKRYVPIADRSEISLGAGKNFTADSYLTSGQLDARYRFHLNDKWDFSVGGSYVFNSLSDAGQRLLSMEGILPDAAFVRYRADALAGYNLFYGKFRLSMDNVLYFDQYLAAGPGVVGLNTGTEAAGVGDVGFVFWMGRRYNARLGLKDYFYDQKRVLTSGYVNDLVGHLDIGILLGGDRS